VSQMEAMQTAIWYGDGQRDSRSPGGELAPSWSALLSHCGPPCRCRRMFRRFWRPFRSTPPLLRNTVTPTASRKTLPPRSMAIAMTRWSTITLSRPYLLRPEPRLRAPGATWTARRPPGPVRASCCA